MRTSILIAILLTGILVLLSIQSFLPSFMFVGVWKNIIDVLAVLVLVGLIMVIK